MAWCPCAQDLLVKYKDFVLEKGGVIHRLEDWGCRKLAYPIKKSNEAYYVLMNYEMKPADAKEMSDDMSKDLDILRFMVLTRDYAITGAYQTHHVVGFWCSRQGWPSTRSYVWASRVVLIAYCVVLRTVSNAGWDRTVSMRDVISVDVYLA
eukprot:scaffold200_cov401-Prasinococcus_capsulatus_cf.AAC.7